jgi:hypothetical protein
LGGSGRSGFAFWNIGRGHAGEIHRKGHHCWSRGGRGVRGSLDPPPGAKANGTAKSAESAGTQPDSAAPPKPHEGFILDPLLR